MLLNDETNLCAAFQAQITAHLDNELSQTDSDLLLAHVSACPSCTKVYEHTRQALKNADAWNVAGADLWEGVADRLASEPNKFVAESASLEDLRAVLTEMRELRAEIQELRSDVGSLRRLLSATRQAAPAKVYRPVSPPQLMPLALPEKSEFGPL